jgi:hypothetical protein
MLGKVFKMPGKMFRSDAEKLRISIQGNYTVIKED